MATEVVCHGCGQAVEVPEDYRRNKIQCPACGVICPVTAPAAKKGAAAAPPRRAPTPSYEEPNWFADESPAPPAPAEAPPEPDLLGPAHERRSEPADTPAPTPPSPKRQRVEEPAEAAEPERAAGDAAPPRRKEKAPEFLVPCRRCGRMIRRQRECPDCDAAEVLPAPAGDEPVIPRLELPETGAAEDEEENSDPYALTGGDIRLCPKCQKEMPPGAVVCVGCGFHLHQRKKLVKTYQPLQRSWETDYTLKQRLTVFAVLFVLTLVGGAAATSAGADASVFAGSVFLFILMGSFLLGTYSRLDVERNSRGRARVTKAWRVCFVPLAPRPLELVGYEGIVTGRSREVQFWEWLVLFSLLVGGILPGIIWWYFVMHKVRFHAALAQDHGYPAVYLFDGWSEEQMKDIARTVADAARLPVLQG